MSLDHPMLELLRALHRRVRDGVLDACRAADAEALAAVVGDDEGDTLYEIDRVGESLLVESLAREAAAVGGLVLVAEGLRGGPRALPDGRPESACRYRVLVDPIDGTRGLMYQKRSAWVLTAVAPNRGDQTRIGDVELAVQSEIPVVKQTLADCLWAVRGEGAHAERVNLTSGNAEPLLLRPSRARTLEHGYATFARFFPGARAELGALDEEVLAELLGVPPAGKARTFEDQYACSGGQLYELAAGRDRFVADLRPLFAPALAARGWPRPLSCHPYDVCTALVAEELGVVVESPAGGALDCPLDLETDVAWVGYANRALAELVGPVLRRALARRGLLVERSAEGGRREHGA